MADVKYKLNRFSLYDQYAIEQHLENMASCGWFIDNMGSFLWRYRKVIPEQLRFSITYFPDASDYDPKPTTGQLILEDYANKDGWELATRWGPMQVFYNKQEDPIPIETDPITQVNTIHRSMKKNTIPSHLLLLALFIFQISMYLWQYNRDPLNFLSGISIYLTPSSLLLSLSVIIELSLYYSWYRKAKKIALEENHFHQIKAKHTVSYLLILATILLMAFVAVTSIVTSVATLLAIVMVFSLLALLLIVKKGLKKKGVSAKINRMITILLSFILTPMLIIGLAWFLIKTVPDESRRAISSYEYRGHTFLIYDAPLPLKVDDMLEIEGKWSNVRRTQESIILSHTKYDQNGLLMEDNNIPNLSYNITKIKIPYFYDVVKQSILDSHQDILVPASDYIDYDSYIQIDGTLFGEHEVYQLKLGDRMSNTYLICSDSQIVEITFYWEPSSEQIAVAMEKLGIDSIE